MSVVLVPCPNCVSPSANAADERFLEFTCRYCRHRWQIPVDNFMAPLHRSHHQEDMP